jgi:hypothetical protein
MVSVKINRVKSTIKGGMGGSGYFCQDANIKEIPGAAFSER